MLDRVVVVLVEPQDARNVGSAARAMQNMGLQHLVIVAPPAFDPEQARWMAPGCDDLLSRLRIVATLDEALEGVDVVVGSTARHRKQGHPVLSPRDLAVRVREDAPRTWAVLFGREDFGLSTADVLRCDSIVRIPTPEHASLNLAQAVLLIASGLFEEARAAGIPVATGRTLGGSRGTSTTASKSKPDRRDAPADVPRLEPAVADLVELLERVGYFRSTQPDKTRLTARQALQRGRVSVRQLQALRGMIARVRWALDHPEADWRATRADHHAEPSDPSTDPE